MISEYKSSAHKDFWQYVLIVVFALCALWGVDEIARWLESFWVHVILNTILVSITIFISTRFWNYRKSQLEYEYQTSQKQSVKYLEFVLGLLFIPLGISIGIYAADQPLEAHMRSVAGPFWSAFMISHGLYFLYEKTTFWLDRK